MSDPVYIPLGPKVSEGLAWLAAEGVINAERVLGGLPHPSGANAERIAYFLGEKRKTALSTKADGDKLDQIRSTLTNRIATLA